MSESLGVKRRYLYRYALRGYSGAIPAAKLELLRADPSVSNVEPETTLRVAAKKPPPLPPPPEAQPAQVPSFAVRRIGGTLSSARSGDGQGAVDVPVAMLDGGIDTDHPDLNGRGGVDCGDGQGYEDLDGHGTMVAGFIGAKDNDIGRVGMAPGTPLYAVRVADRAGFSTNAQVACGLDWVTSTRRDSDAANDIAAADLGLGGPFKKSVSCTDTQPTVVRAALCGSSAAGVTSVVSAGNETQDVVGVEPATFDDVLTVTAMANNDGQPGGLGGQLCEPPETDDTIATFSNFASLPTDRQHTVAAPGVCVGSTYPNGNYALGSGTSFASPLAAGTVALCIHAGPCRGLTPSQIVGKIVADAAAYNNANPSYGFVGDALRPITGKYYGYLIRAGLY